MNLPVNIAEEEDEELRTMLSQLEYGNKISILGGDYLLANASTGLASLRIPKVVEIVSIAIAEFTQAEFLGLQDPQVKHSLIQCTALLKPRQTSPTTYLGRFKGSSGLPLE